MNKRLQKLISVIITLCLAVGLVPLLSVPASANVTTNLVFTATASQSGVGYTWEHTTRTLTLTNFIQNLSATQFFTGISLPINSSIILVGNNQITLNNNASFAQDSSGISSASNLTISGTGSLTISAGRTTGFNWSNGIFAGGTLTIESGTINATAGISVGGTSQGIHANQIVINGGRVTAAGSTGGSSSLGISAHSSLIINSGSVIARGNTRAFSQAPNLPTLFTAWADVVNADPGGNGSTSYTYNANHRFVRIASRHNVTAPTNTTVSPTTATFNTAYSGTITAGAGFNRPLTITMTVGGVSFAGHNYNSSNGTFSIPAANMTGNVIITGTAAPRTFTLAFSRPDADTETPGSASSTATFNSAILSGTAWVAPQRIGYTFDGYWTTDSGTGSKIITPGGELIASVSGYTNASRQWIRTSSETLHARWITNTYTVVFNTNGGTGSMTDQNFTYGAVQDLTANAFTKQGHQFTGWNTAPDGSGTPLTDSQSVENLTDENNGTVNLYAQWGIPPFVGKVDVQDNTDSFTVSGSNLEEIFNHPVTDGNTGVTSEEMQDGNTVTLTLNVRETCEDTAAGAEEIIEETRGRLMQFFNITVTKTVNNNDPVTLTELPVPIQITIDLSEELSGRTGYTVYRFHGNEVQQLGMDTDAEEFFTVSRGTGENGTDQVIIHTMRFSTYAVVENIRTVDDLPSQDDVDVQARIVDNTSRVYRIDIEWGDMKFVFSPDDFAGTWNPETMQNEGAMAQGWHGFEDGNNKIVVHNHSNAGVRVSFAVSENSFDGDVDMDVLQTNDESGTLAVNMVLGKVPLSGENAPSINAFLRIDGEPSDDDIKSFADVWHRVGIITVTITPDGVGLTPRR